MTMVEVATLKLKCDLQQRDRTRFAIEDGLRTAIPDDRRLVLLRKMQIGGSLDSLNPVQRQHAIKDGWLTAISGARHGGDDGAADANCVWFASLDEAETMLLSRLLAGRAVDGWYWKLALPDWHGRPLRNWLGECLGQAIALSEDQRVLAIVRTCIVAGAVDRLIEAIADSGHSGAVPFRARSSGESSTESLSPQSSKSLSQIAEPTLPSFAGSMPAGLRAIIARLIGAGGGAQEIARSLVRAWVLRISPAVAIAPALLSSIVSTLIEAVISGRGTEHARRNREWQPPLSPPLHTEQSAQDTPGLTTMAMPLGDLQGKPNADPLAAPSPLSPERPTIDLAKPEEVLGARRLRHSDHAGLWLVIPSLIELGFDEWLEARPSLLVESPASQLLHAIARHHRVKPDDAALIGLGLPVEPDAHAGWCRMWTRGLDGWLRRTVRRRLHDLVNRPGELDWGDLRLDIRFPATHADIALRRRALDRDPGWVNWLGLSVRYHFDDAEDWV